MPDPAWPGSLPADVLASSYEETLPEMAVRTEMDAGPAKLRRRFTAAVRPLRGRMLLTRTQVAALDTFYVATLAGGTLPFTFTHPRTLATVTMRFVKPPRIAIDKGVVWQADLDLEVMP